MGDARTGRPFCRRYALCSCKSISTEVSARNNTAAQKNILRPKTTLILRLNPCALRKSQPATQDIQVKWRSTVVALESGVEKMESVPVSDEEAEWVAAMK